MESFFFLGIERVIILMLKVYLCMYLNVTLVTII